MHYDPNLPLHLAPDVSSYGLDAVLSHVLKGDTEHTIAYVSRILPQSERNYAQI